MEKELPYYDQNGVEIEEGDLLKIFHFVHYKRRRKCYMYHVAILQKCEDGLWWAGKDYNRHDGKGHYWLKAITNKITRIYKGCEIISKPNWENEEKLRSEARYRLKTLNNPS